LRPAALAIVTDNAGTRAILLLTLVPSSLRRYASPHRVAVVGGATLLGYLAMHFRQRYPGPAEPDVRAIILVYLLSIAR
jgi:hypothetical protein